MIKKDQKRLIEFIETQQYINPENLEINMEEPAVEILLKNSPLYFTIIRGHDSFNFYAMSKVDFEPTFTVEDVNGNFGPYSFSMDDVMYHFENWVNHSAKEYLENESMPSYINMFNAKQEQLNASKINFDEEVEFIEEEKQFIRQGLNEIKLLLKEQIKLSEAESELFNNRINLLDKKLDKLNKAEWKGYAINLLTSAILNLSLDTEKGNQIWNLFSNIFASFKEIFTLIP